MDLVGNPEDRFSHNEAQIPSTLKDTENVTHIYFAISWEVIKGFFFSKFLVNVNQHTFEKSVDEKCKNVHNLKTQHKIKSHKLYNAS